MGLFDDMRAGMTRLIQAGAERLAPEPDVPFDDLQDALRKAGLASPTDEKPRTLFHDPYSTYDWGGWREKPSGVTLETLRMMASRNTVIAAIIQTRVNQVSQFARPQQGRYDKGFRVMLRDRRDNERSMSPAEQKQAAEIERMLETTGLLLPDEKPSSRDSFRDFVKKIVRDALTYDQICIEKVRDRAGRISRFYALPSETIRPAILDWQHTDPKELHERVAYVQVYEDTPIAEYSPDDLAWAVMNPRSDIRVNGFGFSPVEQLINLVTAWLYGFQYNQNFFTQGSAIKGVINIKGTVPDRQLKAFRRMWYSMISGVNNAWRTPILNSDDLQWVSMHSTNREMEFSAWMDWLTKLTCAVFGVDPVEINFQYGNTGQSSSLNQPDNEKKVVESKDRGLRPLMEHIQDTLNKHIIWEINPDFEFSFSGIDAKSEEQEREGLIKESAAYKTIDEVRAQLDLLPLADGKGDLILSPVYLQYAQGMEGGGEEGDDEGGMGTAGDLFSEEGEGTEETDDAEDADGKPLFGDEGEDDDGSDEEDDEEDFERSFSATTSQVHEVLKKASIRTRDFEDRTLIEIKIPGGQ